MGPDPAAAGGPAPAPPVPDAGAAGPPAGQGRPPVPAGEFFAAVTLIWAVEVLLAILFQVFLEASGGGLGIEENAALFSPLGAAMLLGVTSLGAAFTLATVWFVACRRRGVGIARGIDLGGGSLREVGIGVAVGVLLAAAALAAMSLWPPGKSFMAKLASSPHGIAALSILGLAVPPVEEAYYRGFVFPFLRRAGGAVVALAGTSVWFAAAHLPQLRGDEAGFAVVAAAGVVWTAQRLRTGRIVMPLACHWTYNAVLIAVTWVQRLAAPGEGG